MTVGTSRGQILHLTSFDYYSKVEEEDLLCYTYPRWKNNNNQQPTVKSKDHTLDPQDGPRLTSFYRRHHLFNIKTKINIKTKTRSGYWQDVKANGIEEFINNHNNPYSLYNFSLVSRQPVQRMYVSLKEEKKQTIKAADCGARSRAVVAGGRSTLSPLPIPFKSLPLFTQNPNPNPSPNP